MKSFIQMVGAVVAFVFLCAGLLALGQIDTRVPGASNQARPAPTAAMKRDLDAALVRAQDAGTDMERAYRRGATALQYPLSKKAVDECTAVLQLIENQRKQIRQEGYPSNTLRYEHREIEKRVVKTRHDLIGFMASH